MRPSEAVLAPAGSRSFFCSSSIKTLFLVLWLSLWTSQLTCCALSLMPTLFWHTSPSIHKRWFCFWKRKVNTKSMLARAYFMETIAHLGIAFLKTEKEKKIMCQIWCQGCYASEHAWAFFPVRRGKQIWMSDIEQRTQWLLCAAGSNLCVALWSGCSVLCGQAVTGAGEGLNFQRNSWGAGGGKALCQAHEMMPAWATSDDEPFQSQRLPMGSRSPRGWPPESRHMIYEVFKYTTWFGQINF